MDIGLHVYGHWWSLIDIDGCQITCMCNGHWWTVVASGCVILICTRFCTFWLSLKPGSPRVIRYALAVLSQPTCCSFHATCASCVCQAEPTGVGRRGLGIAGPDFFNCDHHTSLLWAVEFLPQAQYLPRRIWVRVCVGYGSFASREVIVYKDVMFCSSIIVCTWLSKSALEIVEL